MYNLTGGEKLVAMTENGPIPDPDECLDLDAPWSYFMSWSDLVVEQNTTTHIRDVYNNPRVLKFGTPVVHDQVTITFKVSNQLTREPLWGASVTVDSLTRPTGRTGESVFTIQEGSYAWSVEMPSYQASTGTLSLHSDTTIFIYLVQTHANVKFRLKNGVTPVNEATVILGEHSLVTNSLGIANFLQLTGFRGIQLYHFKNGIQRRGRNFLFNKGYYHCGDHGPENGIGPG